MQTITITEQQTGCALDSHRGHYIVRDMLLLAIEFGFIVGPFEQWAIDTYDDHYMSAEYPSETLIELSDHALEWLNSGQHECNECTSGSHSDDWPGPGYVWQNAVSTPHGVVMPGAWVICKECSGSGRGPRIKGQNFPPIVPKGYAWDWNDGDFGLYPIDTEE